VGRAVGILWGAAHIGCPAVMNNCTQFTQRMLELKLNIYPNFSTKSTPLYLGSISRKWSLNNCI
jgi:hypothetical protein